MMTLNKAKRLGRESIAHLSGRAVDEISFIDDLTQCRLCGWIFFSAAVRGPVVVTHDGVVHLLGTERAAADAIAELEGASRRARVSTRDP